MRKDAWGQTIQIAALTLYALFSLVARADYNPTPRPLMTPVPRPDPRGGRPVPIPPPPQPRRPEPDPRGGRPLPPRPLPTPNPRGLCPPGTVIDTRINRCVALPPRPTPIPVPMPTIPPRDTRDADEVSAANLANHALQGLSCDQAGEALRRLANMTLSMAQSAMPSRPSSPTDPDFKRAARERIRSPKFWMKVWSRMADAYRSCNRGCFDDGVAVGQISATAYCSASVSLNGLFGPGYLEQTPLPVCETAINTGCIQTYQQTAKTYEGCKPYTEDTFQSIFYEYISQDCHL